LQQLRADTGRWDLQGADALDLATHYTRDNGPMQTLGFAAANALTRCLMDRAGFRPDRSTDSIGQMQPQKGEHIGMIGFFKPLLEPILQSGARLTVLELDPALVTENAHYPRDTESRRNSGLQQGVIHQHPATEQLFGPHAGKLPPRAQVCHGGSECRLPAGCLVLARRNAAGRKLDYEPRGIYRGFACRPFTPPF
jgi:hypothetical protein